MGVSRDGRSRGVPPYGNRRLAVILKRATQDGIAKRRKCNLTFETLRETSKGRM